MLIVTILIHMYTCISVISSAEMDMLKSNAKQFIDCTPSNIQEWRKGEKYVMVYTDKTKNHCFIPSNN